MSDKMREEFEVFMKNKHWSWASGDVKSELYDLWKASRAAITVDLPSTYSVEQEDYKCRVMDCLDDAGINCI